MAELFLGGKLAADTSERTGDDLRIDTDELTTHGVIVGMTGSGKTGLGVVLIEEVLRAGLPALLIDPKGDLTNLALTFPDLAPADFRPWIDEAQAAAAGQTPDAFASTQATQWTEGLASWGLGPDDVASLHNGAEVTIYTPGSRVGVPLNIVGALRVPGGGADPEVVADEIEGYVSGLLNLVGITADPLASREHILLSNLIDHAWSEGRDIDLPTLVAQVQQPPIRKLGVLDLDEFFPQRDRTGLSTKLNGLLASPSFAAWSQGEGIDIDAMLRTPGGAPRCAVVTTAHLSDDERQFVTSLILAKVVTWMRRQSGTTDLRALVYMDEVAGYLPPTENPPTKKPIMTLMKQARAFGVGMVLSTQNPVDIDYKAISNAGIWMVGRLQTAQDRARLLDGMSSASGGVDVNEVADIIAGLAKRQFVVRRAKKDHPELFGSRWAMSYLRGPMTRDQIASLAARQPGSVTLGGPDTPASSGTPGLSDPDVSTPVADNPAPGAAAGEPLVAPAGADETHVMPKVADGIAVRWVDIAAPWLAEVGADPTGVVWEAAVMARVNIRYSMAKADLVHDEEYETVLFPLGDIPDVTVGHAVDYDDRDLRADAPEGAVYRLCDAKIGTKALFTQLKRDLVDHLAHHLSVEVPHNAALKLWGRIDEDPEVFSERCRRAASEQADTEVAKLRDSYAAKVHRVRDQIAAAEDRSAVLAEQAKGKRNSEFLSTAGTALGGILGAANLRDRSLARLVPQRAAEARLWRQLNGCVPPTPTWIGLPPTLTTLGPKGSRRWRRSLTGGMWQQGTSIRWRCHRPKST